MNYLEALTEAGLRRLYKFALKRAIGKYLKDELLIDQLEVSARDGKVVVNELILDCNVINEEFLVGQPFKISSFKLKSLDATISYALFLGNGCMFSIRGVDVVIVPSSAGSPSNISNPNAGIQYDNLDDLLAAPSGHSVGGDNEAVEYIAHWIEVIIASLQVEVFDINIIINGFENAFHNSLHLNRDDKADELSPGLLIKIAKLGYSAMNPALKGKESSASRANDSINKSINNYKSTVDSIRIGDKKQITIDGFMVGIVDINDYGMHLCEKSMKTIVSVEKPISICLRNSRRSQVESVDIDISMALFQVSLTVENCVSILKILQGFLSSKSANNPNHNPNHSPATFDGPENTSRTKEEVLQRLLEVDPQLGKLLRLKGNDYTTPRNLAIAKSNELHEESDDILNLDSVANYLDSFAATRRRVELGLDGDAVEHSIDMLFHSTLHRSQSASSHSINQSVDVDDDDIDFPDGKDDSSIDEEEFEDAQAFESVLKTSHSQKKPKSSRVKFADITDRNSNLLSMSMQKSTYGYANFNMVQVRNKADVPSNTHTNQSSDNQISRKSFIELTKKFHIHLHIDMLSLRLLELERPVNEGENSCDSLLLSCSDLIISASMSSIVKFKLSNARTEIAGINKLPIKASLSISTVSLSQETSLSGTSQSSTTPLVDFYHNSDGSKAVTFGPHVSCEITIPSIDEVDVDGNVTDKPKDFQINLQLSPIVISLHLNIIENWALRLTPIMLLISSMQMDNTGKSSPISFILSIEELTGLVNSHPQTPMRFWDEMEISLNLNNNSDRWHPWLSKYSACHTNRDSLVVEMLWKSKCSGGIALYLRNISVNYKINVDSGTYPELSNQPCKNGQSQSIVMVMEEFRASLFFQRQAIPFSSIDELTRGVEAVDVLSLEAERADYWETVILLALSVDPNDKNTLSESHNNPQNKVLIWQGRNQRNLKNLSKMPKMSSKRTTNDDLSQEDYEIISMEDKEESINGVKSDLYLGSEGLSRPEVSDDDMINIFAYTIAIGLRKREYCALVAIADTFTSSTSSSSKNSSSSSISPDQGIGSFGLNLMSATATISISEDSAEDSTDSLYSPSEMPSAKKEKMNKQNLKADSKTESSNESKRFCLCIAVSKPLIQVLSASAPCKNRLGGVCGLKRETYFAIEAEDMSMFDMDIDTVDNLPTSIAHAMKKQHYNNSETSFPSSRGSRFGKDSCYVPFLHRTTFGSAFRTSLLSASTLMNLEARNHLYRLQLLLTNQPVLASTTLGDGSNAAASTTTTVSFHMSLQDVTLRYDPLSSWLMQVVSILTPVAPHQIISNRISNLQKALTQKPSLSVAATSPEAESGGSKNTYGASNKALSAYAVTKVTISVKNCLIDYCCVASPSRLLFSVEFLSMATTIVSNSSQYGLKFIVRNISLQISNRLLNDPTWEQSPLNPLGIRPMSATFQPANLKHTRSNAPAIAGNDLDLETFINVHAFVKLMTLDSMESLVTINDVINQTPLSLDISMGRCCIYACADSLDVFTETMLHWWNDFKAMMDSAQSLMSTSASEAQVAAPQTASSSNASEQKTNWMKSIDWNAFSPLHLQSSKQTRSTPSVQDIVNENENFGTTSESSDILGKRNIVNSTYGSHANVSLDITSAMIEDYYDSHPSDSANPMTANTNSKLLSLPKPAETKFKPVAIDKHIFRPQTQKEPKNVDAYDSEAESDVEEGMNGRWLPQYDDDQSDDAGFVDESDGDFSFENFDDESHQGSDDIESVQSPIEDMYKNQSSFYRSDTNNEYELRSTSVLPTKVGDGFISDLNPKDPIGSSFTSSSLSMKSDSLDLKISQNKYSLNPSYEIDDSEMNFDDNDTFSDHSSVNNLEDGTRLMSHSYYSIRGVSVSDGDRPGTTHSSVKANASKLATSIMLDDLQDAIKEENINDTNEFGNDSVMRSHKWIKSSDNYWGSLADKYREDIKDRGMSTAKSTKTHLTTSGPIDNDHAIDSSFEDDDIDTFFGSAPQSSQSILDLKCASLSADDTQRNYLIDYPELLDPDMADMMTNLQSYSNIHDIDSLTRINQLKSTATQSSLFGGGLMSRMAEATADLLTSKVGSELPEEVELEDFNKEGNEIILLNDSLDEMNDPQASLSRFEAIDGVHNALQITINDRVSFRKAGEVFSPRDNARDTASPSAMAHGLEAISTHSNRMNVVGVYDEEPSQNRSAKIEEAATKEVLRVPSLGERRRNIEPSIAATAVSDCSVVESVLDLFPCDKNTIVTGSNPVQSHVSASKVRPKVQFVIDDTTTEMQLAWKDFDDSNPTRASKSFDQRAIWYVDPESIVVNHYHIPVPGSTKAEALKQHLPAVEAALPLAVLVKIKASIRLRIFNGYDWSDSPPIIVPDGHSNLAENAKNAKSSSSKHGAEDSLSRNRHLDDLLSGSSASATTKRSLFEPSSNTSSGHRRPSSAQGTHKSSSVSANATGNTPRKLTSREEGDTMDISLTHTSSVIRVYDLTPSDDAARNFIRSEDSAALPCQRVSFNAADLQVSHSRIGRQKKKIFGWWRTNKQPRSPGAPIIQVSMVGYDQSSPSTVRHSETSSARADDIEHRVAVEILPLRCYMDPNVVKFLQDLGLRQEAIDRAKVSSPSRSAKSSSSEEAVGSRTSNSVFFQMIKIGNIDIKIDYQPTLLDIAALQAGDYIQLLNLVPLEGLELTLKKVRLTGLSGFGPVLNAAARLWIEDIYSNQIHRIVSGTAPFKGISHIGLSLQDLLRVPLTHYKHRRALLRDVQRKSSNLVRTVGRETLHASYQVSALIAQVLRSLAGPGSTSTYSGSSSRRRSTAATVSGNRRNRSEGSQRVSSSRVSASSKGRAPQVVRQPMTFTDGLERAYGAMTREVGEMIGEVVTDPLREYRRSGSTVGLLHDVSVALPGALIRPVAGVAEGLSHTLLSLRNVVDPEQRVDEEDMWNVEASTYGKPL